MAWRDPCGEPGAGGPASFRARMTFSLILHGGAKTVSASEEDANRAGCLAALNAGHAVLASGGESVAAVEAVIRILEDDPTFNAGYGSALNCAGEAEMCAGIMEGSHFNVGAVTV